jgi:hypothetical protein
VILAVLAIGILLMGCVTGPDPIVIQQDRRHAVRLEYDPKAGAGFQHPYAMTIELMAKVLRGLGSANRDTVGGFGVFADQELTPAFTDADVALLTPPLSKALRTASPHDLATFYLTVPDATHGHVITSGGMFIREHRLYVILANSRSYPAGGQDYTSAMELDNRDAPLLPITPFRFRVGFRPADAAIPAREAMREESFPSYMDPAKVIVVDLRRLSKDEPSSRTK